MKNSKLQIDLTSDEALVLFEFLSRFDEDEVLTVEDSSEERVLSRIHGRLQSQLVEPFDPDYRKLLESARSNLREHVG